jgi:hypothetical protein
MRRSLIRLAWFAIGVAILILNSGCAREETIPDVERSSVDRGIHPFN